MTSVVNFEMGNGSITFHSEVPPQPETKEVNGNVTVMNVAKAGVPAYYEVEFMICAHLECDGLNFSNIFHWKTLVPDISDLAEYRSVEDRAAKQVAPMLRALADRIESEQPNFDRPPD
jgi:hypothetical protein